MNSVSSALLLPFFYSLELRIILFLADLPTCSVRKGLKIKLLMCDKSEDALGFLICYECKYVVICYVFAF